MTVHPKEPIWLVAQIVLAIHDDLLAQHGGLFGLRDTGLFESALARPRHRWEYGEAEDLFDCAASYGFGIAKNDAFNDGNKRTAFQSMYTFLGLNGLELNATEIDAVKVMIGVANGSIPEKRLATWLRDNTAKPRRKRKG
jgi:death-on-curing protein